LRQVDGTSRENGSDGRAKNKTPVRHPYQTTTPSAAVKEEKQHDGYAIRIDKRGFGACACYAIRSPI
jgi:hypothetical protein